MSECIPLDHEGVSSLTRKKQTDKTPLLKGETLQWLPAGNPLLRRVYAVPSLITWVFPLFERKAHSLAPVPLLPATPTPIRPAAHPFLPYPQEKN